MTVNHADECPLPYNCCTVGDRLTFTMSPFIGARRLCGLSRRDCYSKFGQIANITSKNIFRGSKNYWPETP
jgi:hypothetical protein